MVQALSMMMTVICAPAAAQRKFQRQQCRDLLTKGLLQDLDGAVYCGCASCTPLSTELPRSLEKFCAVLMPSSHSASDNCM